MTTASVPTFQQILAAAVDRGLGSVAASSSAEVGSLRFPVVVSPLTRSKLEAVSNEMDSSLAAVAGAILDAVAEASIEKYQNG